MTFHNGQFRIMIVSDSQDCHTIQPDTLRLIEAGLDKISPDLVVFLGDNVAQSWDGVNEQTVEQAIAAVVAPVEKRNLSFAFVFGNHDRQTGVSNARQTEFFKKHRGCLGRAGDYHLTVCGENSTQVLLNLFFIDSGSECKNKLLSFYDFVHKGQLQWYEETVEALARETGGIVPSFVFQHIPVREVFKGMRRVLPGTKGAVRGQTRNVHIHYVLNPKCTLDGTMNEAPCPPDYNSGQFASWKKKGDVAAAFFGHDHVNDFHIVVDGIHLVHTAGAGFFSYGNGPHHGVREIVVYENDVKNFETRMHYFKDLVGGEYINPGSEYKGFASIK